jgi:hypothetical protein
MDGVGGAKLILSRLGCQRLFAQDPIAGQDDEGEAGEQKQGWHDGIHYK